MIDITDSTAASLREQQILQALARYPVLNVSLFASLKRMTGRYFKEALIDLKKKDSIRSIDPIKGSNHAERFYLSHYEDLLHPFLNQKDPDLLKYSYLQSKLTNTDDYNLAMKIITGLYRFPILSLTILPQAISFNQRPTVREILTFLLNEGVLSEKTPSLGSNTAHRLYLTEFDQKLSPFLQQK